MPRNSSADRFHKNAADHHDRAAHHHRKAAKHHAAGNQERAAHHAHAARGHSVFANESANQASKQHAMDENGMRAGPRERDDEGRFADEDTKMGRSGYGRGEDNYGGNWSSSGDDDRDDEDENNYGSSKSMRGMERDEDEDEDNRSSQNGRSHRAVGGRSGSIKQAKGRNQRGGARSHAA